MNIGTWTITNSKGEILSPPEQTALDLGATGLNEILQNVRIIVNTRIGTVMLDRKFGLNYSFLDAPMNKAQLIIVQQMCLGLTQFEPRITFTGIRFSPNIVNPGEMDVMLAVHIDQSELVLPTT